MATVKDLIKAPILPKTSPCKSMTVLDVEADKSVHTWEAKEALMTATVIQGLVNRESDDKIYFVNYPNEHFWNTCPADKQQLETEGFFSVPYAYAELPEDKKYPALSYLLTHYADVIKGAVLCPSLNEKVCDGAVMAAITACGQLDAIPVTAAMEEYIRQEGLSLPVLEDTRGLKENGEALEWSLKHYFNENTTRKFVGHHTYTSFGGQVDDQFPNLYDYYIANRAFVFCLNGNAQQQEEKLKLVLNEKNYPLATPVMGLPVDEAKGLETIERCGYYLIVANAQNLSCTSGMTVEENELTKQPEPKDYNADADTAYVAFCVTDGDSLGFSMVFHYDEVHNNLKSNDIPMGWSFNPLLFDVYPSLVKWRWNHNPSYHEMILEWNDTAQAGTLRRENREAWKLFCAQHKRYRDALGMYTTNYIGYGQDMERGLEVCDDDYIRESEPLLQIEGYQGFRGSSTIMKIMGNSVSTTLTGHTGSRDPASMKFDIETSISRVPDNEPAFVFATLGDGRADYGGGDFEYKVAELVKRLKNSSSKRKYQFVMPKDLAATFRAWTEKNGK